MINGADDNPMITIATISLSLFELRINLEAGPLSSSKLFSTKKPTLNRLSPDECSKAAYKPENYHIIDQAIQANKISPSLKPL